MNKNYLLIYLNFIFSIVLAAPLVADAQTTFPKATCKEFRNSVFKPCICANQVPKLIQYKPTLAACGGKAAAILNGGLADAFSVVLRNKMNADRWPASGYNGCTAAEVALGLNKCSAFKCQKVIRTRRKYTCCFGEVGTSKILAGATRMTIKLRDVPNSTSDPLLRICLNNFTPKLGLN